MNLLFVSSGRRVSLLEAFKKEKLPGDKLVCVDSNNLVSTAFIADKFYQVPPWSQEWNFMNSLLRIVEEEQIDAIISLMDPATALLVKVFTKRPLLLSTSLSLNRIANNKLFTSTFFKDCKVNTPSIKGIKQVPVIARQLHGYGSRDMQILLDEDDIKYFQKKHNLEDYIFTDFLSNAVEFTVDCFKDMDGKVITVIPRKRLEVRSGEVQKGESLREQPLINLVQEKILPHLDFIGPICIQVLKVDNTYWFIEINDRFGGGVPLSFASGANMPRWIFDMLSGRQPKPLEYFYETIMLRSDRETYYTQPGVIFG